MKNLPNHLTVSRVVLVFIFVIFANPDTDNMIIHVNERTAVICHLIAYVVAIIAGFTDFFDGYLARKYKLESDFGKLMDPLADKIFVLATFVMMADYKQMPAWIVIVILSREFMVTGLRMLASSKGIVIAADKWGKIKTCLQMAALAVGGLAWVCRFPLKTNPNPWVWGSWYAFLLVVTFVTISSGIGYYVKHKNLFLENN